LIQVLPKEGDIFTQRVVRDLRSTLGLSDEDWKTYEIVKFDDGRVQWNPMKDVGVEYSFGPKATELIVSALVDLDKAKKVNDDFISLFDKFLPEEKPEVNVEMKA
jgi:hypothetical protein